MVVAIRALRGRAPMGAIMIKMNIKKEDEKDASEPKETIDKINEIVAETDGDDNESLADTVDEENNDEETMSNNNMETQWRL